MGTVIDASFAATLFLPDESSARSSDRFAEIARDVVIAPALWQIEIINVLIMAHRRKRISAAVLGQLIDVVGHLPIAIESPLSPVQRATVANLAISYELTAYDAVYLESAVRRGFALITLDSALMKAARAVGIQAPS
jgi:predicted nucleic acid-binding protein